MESKLKKIVVVGDGGVGKTTMLHRYIKNEFLVDTKMTIGVGFFQKYVSLEDGRKVYLQLWDFGGEKHFRAFLDSYVLGANGALLLFDLTLMKTLNQIDNWVKIVRKYNSTLPIVFIGSKCDLKEKISVSDDYALQFKEKYNFFEYIKTSSKTGENIEKVFELITKKVITTKS